MNQWLQRRCQQHGLNSTLDCESIHTVVATEALQKMLKHPLYLVEHQCMPFLLTIWLLKKKTAVA